MGKIEQLKRLVDEICSQYGLCKDCPLNNKLSPYTFERVCRMIDKIKEDK